MYDIRSRIGLEYYGLGKIFSKRCKTKAKKRNKWKTIAFGNSGVWKNPEFYIRLMTIRLRIEGKSE